MSVFNCNTGCFTSELGARYDKGVCGDVLRSFGIEFALLFRCDLTDFTLMDTTATTGDWDVALTANQILKTPRGSLVFGDSSDEVAGETGCGDPIIDFSEIPFTFETFQTAADRSDEAWFYNLDQQFDNYSLGWIDCEGFLYIGDIATSAVLDDSATEVDAGIGYRMSKTRRPQWVAGNGAGKAGKWVMEGLIRTRAVARGIEVPDLAALLNAN